METPAGPEDVAPQEAAALEVDVLDCGTIEVSDLDAFSSAGDFAGQTDTFTDTCFLVRHPHFALQSVQLNIDLIAAQCSRDIPDPLLGWIPMVSA